MVASQIGSQDSCSTPVLVHKLTDPFARPVGMPVQRRPSSSSAHGMLVRKPVGLYRDEPNMQLSHLTKKTLGSAADVSKLGNDQRYDRLGFSTMKYLPSSRAILHTEAVQSAIWLASLICSYSCLDRPSVKPRGHSADRSCRQWTPGIFLSLTLEKVLHSGAMCTAADSPA